MPDLNKIIDYLSKLTVAEAKQNVNKRIEFISGET